MELLGLAIIMVIVMIGIILALQFFFLRVPNDPTQAARDKQLGANLLDSMLETTSNCRDVPLLTLLQDCARGGGISDCSADQTTGVGGGTSCEHAHATIAYMLNQTLDT